MGSICTKPGEVVEVGDDKHNLEDIVDCNPDAGFKSKGKTILMKMKMIQE